MIRWILISLLLTMLSVSSCSKVVEEIKQTTISGHVTYDGTHTFPRTFVFLLTSPSDTSHIMLANGTIVMDDGSYEIIRVEDGVYYLFAIADTNGDNEIDPQVDPFGWYGHRDPLTGLTIADSIVVSGTSLTGIDIDTMYVLPISSK